MPRDDPVAARLNSPYRTPRVVVGIMFPVGSIYCTNAAAIANVPGTPIHGSLQQCASISQELNPEDARATLGSFTFSVVDLASALTDELRAQLFAEAQGPRGNEVRIFTGDTDDFSDGTWRRVATYIIDGVIENDTGLYTFNCVDRLRETRTEIFDLKMTRLAESIDDVQTSITVLSTAGFAKVQHTASFTDSPLQFVGYLYVKKTREIIRYLNTDATHFLDCTRSVNSAAAALEVSGTQEQWPEIIEFPYLEMSAPELAWTLLTGEILGTGFTIPTTWHCGVAITDCVIESFQNIGVDLYDPADPAGGLIMRLIHLGKEDGKRFIEQEILQPAGLYFAITPEGKIALRRLTTVLGNASYVAALSAADVVSTGPLQHDQSGVVNQLTVDFNWDGEEFTRRELLFNAASIATHGTGGAKKIELKGLPVTQQSYQAVRRMWLGLSSRYGAPPLYIQLQLMPQFNYLEVGDIIRVALPQLEDYAGAGTLDRSWEIQRQSMNWITGELLVDLFASSAQTPPEEVTDINPIDDAWYQSEGTALTSVTTIAGGAMTDPGSGLTGAADLRDPSAIYYYGGNLTINTGVNLTITQNVQLRILGTLNINGAIWGIGSGLTGIADPNVIDQPPVALDDIPGYTREVATLGSTQGSDSLYLQTGLFLHYHFSPLQTGLAAIPEINVYVEAGGLQGLPSDLRGTAGAFGAPVYERAANGATAVKRLGSAGGVGGAGLVIVCRGLSFGVAGEINLSGTSGGVPASVSISGHTVYPGAGGGGAPGGLFVVHDGPGLFPDLSGGNFIANQGATQQTGNPVKVLPPEAVSDPLTGYGPGITTADHWDAHSNVRFIENEVGLGEGVDELPPKPEFVSYLPQDYGIEVTLSVSQKGEYDRIEIWGSIDNALENATLRGTDVIGQHFRIPLQQIQTLFLWARSVQGARRSEWSSAANAGFLATGGAPYREVAAWLESFDAYTSREDFEREWEIVSGDPVIEVLGGGINGGKMLRVWGLMRARYRRFIPYDHNQIYECAARFRAASADPPGNLQLSLGFFGATPTTEIDTFGNPFSLTGAGWSNPNRVILSSCDISQFGDWQRAITWITGSITTQLTSVGFDLPFRDFIAPWRPNDIHAITATGEKAAYIRPTIECNQPAGGGSDATDIDYIELRKLASTDVGLPELADGHLSLANDYEYWCAPTGEHDATLDIGTGINGANELVFSVDPTMTEINTIFAVNRNAIKVADNVKVAIHYRFTTANSISAEPNFGVLLQGLALSGEMPRHMGTPFGTGPTAEVTVNTLTTDGSTNVVTFTFSNLLTDSHLVNADYFRLILYINLWDVTDDLVLRVQRVRFVRS